MIASVAELLFETGVASERDRVRAILDEIQARSAALFVEATPTTRAFAQAIADLRKAVEGRS